MPLVASLAAPSALVAYHTSLFAPRARRIFTAAALMPAKDVVGGTVNIRKGEI